MNALHQAERNSFLPAVASPLADVTPHGFFAPVSRSVVEDLLKAYERDEAKVKQIASMAVSFFGTCLHHFLKGNVSAEDGRPPRAVVERIFAEDGAIASLRASYWQQALSLTDVYDHMPQARRDEWNKSIKDLNTPEFTPETVIPTLRDLLLSRERFLAERVDGVFRNLSGEHLTNSPEGFGKRMIIAHLVTSYGSTNTDRVGYINDLRCIISRFMGRGEPRWYASNKIVEEARTQHRGEWVTIDGGSLRFRAYKCGTAHLEVHPEMAWRLNAVLSTLYPLAIPSQFRTKPKKKSKDFVILGKLLPFRILEVLGDCKPVFEIEGEDRLFHRSRRTLHNTLSLPYGEIDKTVREQVVEILEAIGGVRHEKGGYWEFDYIPDRVVREILETGMVPDQKSHQFYPTPEHLAERLVVEAEIAPHHRVVEPSAGQGHIAKLLPKDMTTCVEISPLHCRILRSKGFRTVERDFLDWAGEQVSQSAFHDRVVMNPPFSEGRAALHLEAARSILAPGGQIVAILPASFRGKQAPSGWVYAWSELIENEFADTSVSVVILKAGRTS